MTAPRYLLRLSLALLIWITGCDTSGRMMKKAASLENKSQYTEAARIYLNLLSKKNPKPEARQMLQTTGDAAIRQLNTEALNAAGLRDYKKAAQAYRTMDDLITQADQVNVSLFVPPNYREERRAALDAAIRSLLTQADQSAEKGKWQEALDMLAEARKYDPTPDQFQVIETEAFNIADRWAKGLALDAYQAEGKRNWGRALELYERAERTAPDERMREEMRQARSFVFMRWAEEDLRNNRPRLAYERANKSLDLNPRNEDAQALARRAIEQGTRNVAMLPFYRVAAAETEMPNSFLAEFNDELQFGYWAKPPVFVRTNDPRDIRRIMREEKLDNRMISDDPAYALGRKIGADYIVFGEITRFAVTERKVNEKNRSAKVRTGGQTPYAEATFERKVEATVSFRILDLRNRRVLNMGGANHTEETRYTTAIFTGDVNQLDLSRSERDLFSQNRKTDALNTLLTNLVKALGQKTAEQVYGKLLDRMN